ncbi:DNA-3-methyladenine glycosylase [Candidatus Peregrinibacteria bacterium]|nr:DNA-3-methyladenine glycosylase [Candidatus Peregrinibacteria bacterium]
MEKFSLLPYSWFTRDAIKVARDLLGKKIVYKNYSGIIVETEAYTEDEASHGHKITPRSEIMLTTYGHIYVYFIYGMYHCLNITTNKDSCGAVLIRAVEPLSGIQEMKKNRHTENLHNLTSGPGKLCEAFEIGKKLNGTKVNEKIFLYDDRRILSENIGVSERIGIEKAKHLPWRFFIRGNKFLSR